MGKSDSVTAEFNKSVTVVYKTYFRVIGKLGVSSNTDKEVASDQLCMSLVVVCAHLFCWEVHMELCCVL